MAQILLIESYTMGVFMKKVLTIFCLSVLGMLNFCLADELPKLECHALRGQIHFLIVDQQLKLIQGQERTPASIPTLINRLQGQTLTQVTYIQGQRHRIFLENVFDLENSSNTLSLRSKQGHEMTYPLNCQNINNG